METGRTALAAIEYALRADEGLEFLRCCLDGKVDAIREKWPDCPQECVVEAGVVLQRKTVALKHREVRNKCRQWLESRRRLSLPLAAHGGSPINLHL